MLRRIVCFAVLAIVAGSSSGQSSEPGLSAQGRAFLDALYSAGWTGQSSANGVKLTVRMAPLCSSGMLNAVRHRKDIDDRRKKPLDDFAEVVLPSPGWFLERLVPAGTYHLGLDFESGEPLTTLNDEHGQRLTSRSFWINETTDKNATGSVSAGQGAATVRIQVGGIRLAYRFVPERRHDALAASLKTTTSGPVRIHSDLTAKTELLNLARDAEASLSVQAKLLGCEVPEGLFDIYLFGDGKAFEEMDGLLTGGEFKSARAFTSRVTGRSYLHYGPRHDSDALADHGFTLKMRSLVLHELHHQIAGRAFPHSLENWPDWIAEALAEVGSQWAMQARSRTDGQALDDLHLGNWLHADRIGAVPPIEDLVGGYKKSGRTAWYTTCYLLARQMVSKPKRVHELVAAITREATVPAAAVRAREEFVRLYGDVDGLLDRAARSARGMREPPPAVTSGYLDPVGDVWRLVSGPGRPARVILPTPVEKTDGVTLTTTFSYHPSGQQQLDIYLCHREGRHTEQFLKVAVLPKKIILFWFRHGSWRTCWTVNYDDSLAIGTATKRVWHPLKVAYRVADQKVRVDTTGGRWAELEVPGFIPVSGTHAGIGLYDGVAYVKKVMVR